MKNPISFLAMLLILVATGAAHAENVGLLTHRDVSDFSHTFSGSDIYDGGYQNSWSSASLAGISYTTTGDVLNITTTGSTSGSTLNGTASTDGGATTWLSGVNDDFTVEMSLRVNDAPNGLNLWMGNDNEQIIVSIYEDRIVTTNNGGGLKTVFSDMTSSYRTLRVVSDGGAGNSDIHVWLDGVSVSDVPGGVYNSGTNDSRLLFGDTTSGTFGDDFDVDIRAFSYETSGAFAPNVVVDNLDLATPDTTGSQATFGFQSFTPDVGGIGLADSVDENAPIADFVALESATFLRAPSGTAAGGDLYIDIYEGTGNGGTYVGSSLNAIDVNSAAALEELTWFFDNLKLDGSLEYSMVFSTDALAGSNVSARLAAANNGGGFVDTYTGGSANGAPDGSASPIAFDSRFAVRFTPIPAPAALPAGLLMLAGLAARRRRVR